MKDLLLLQIHQRSSETCMSVTITLFNNITIAKYGLLKLCLLPNLQKKVCCPSYLIYLCAEIHRTYIGYSNITVAYL